jgi:hypothetical protein
MAREADERVDKFFLRTMVRVDSFFFFWRDLENFFEDEEKKSASISFDMMKPRKAWL